MTRFPNPAKVPANATTPSWTASASAPFGRGDLNAVRRRTAAEPPLHLAVDRPGQIAAEGAAAAARRFRPPGRPAGRRWPCRAAWPAASAGSSAARRRAARSGRASDRCRGRARARACAARWAAACAFRGGASQRSRARVRRCSSACARALQLGERLLMRGDAVAIELGQRRDRPRGLAQMPQVRRREDQPQIARLAELVDLDQPRAQLRLALPAPRSAAPASARRSPPARPRPSRRRASSRFISSERSWRSISSLRSSPSSVRSCEARRSASRCSACSRSVARRASASVRGPVGLLGGRDDDERKGREDRKDRREMPACFAAPPASSRPEHGPLEDRLAIDITGYRHAEVLQHGRRDIHDVRAARPASGRLEISTPAVCL